MTAPAVAVLCLAAVAAVWAARTWARSWTRAQHTVRDARADANDGRIAEVNARLGHWDIDPDELADWLAVATAEYREEEGQQ